MPIDERLTPIFVNGGPGLIQVLQLDLASTAPVNISGSFFDAFISLDPAHLSDDTGLLLLTGGPLSGSLLVPSLNVWFQADFVDVASVLPTQSFFAEVNFSNSIGTWVSDAQNPFLPSITFVDGTGDQHTAIPVPEPGTGLAGAVGFAGLLACGWRRWTRAA